MFVGGYAKSSDVEKEVERLEGKIELKVDEETLTSKILAQADEIRLKGGNIVIDSENFSVDANGNMCANNGYFSGTIDATSGTFSGTVNSADGEIGGFTINADTLIAGAGSNSVGLSPNKNGYMLWAGGDNPSSATFNVTSSGAVASLRRNNVVESSVSLINGEIIIKSEGISAAAGNIGKVGKCRLGTGDTVTYPYLLMEHNGTTLLHVEALDGGALIGTHKMFGSGLSDGQSLEIGCGGMFNTNRIRMHATDGCVLGGKWTLTDNLYIYYDSYPKPITIGDPDSAGQGYRYLRIPN